MAVLIVVTVLCLVLAILFLNVKANFLIAGYNTMSAEEQAKYDFVALSKFLGKTMFAISGSLFLLILGDSFNSDSFFIAGTVLLVAISLFTVIRTTTGNRFKKQTGSPQ